MMTKLQTSRLELTPLSEDDWQLFYDLHVNDEVIELCFDKPSTKEIEQKFQSRSAPWNKGSTEWLCLVMTDKKTQQKIGITGFFLQEGIAEVGYMILPQFYGCGFATEALLTVIAWAQNELEIEQFSAVIVGRNEKSKRVLLKSGFTLSKTIPNAYMIKGVLYTDHVYRLSKPSQV